MDLKFEPGGEEFEDSRFVLADLGLGLAATIAGFLGLGDVVLEANLGEFIEFELTRDAFGTRPGGSFGLGLDFNFGFRFEVSISKRNCCPCPSTIRSRRGPKMNRR